MELLCFSLQQLESAVQIHLTFQYSCLGLPGLPNLYRSKFLVPFLWALILSYTNSCSPYTHPSTAGEATSYLNDEKQLTIFQKKNPNSNLRSTEVKNSFEGGNQALRTCLLTIMRLWKQIKLHTGEQRPGYVTYPRCKLNLCKTSLFASWSCDLTDGDEQHLNFHYEWGI